jgi:aromatic amino acid aminotransferase I / 2-aminoadipate transaminase
MTRLQTADIEPLRADSGPLPLKPAPFTSQRFKSPYTRGKPLARRWEHYFSLESRDFAGSDLKKGANPFGSPRKIISLGTGRPTANYYPWESLTFHEVSPVPAKPRVSSGVGHSVYTVSKYGATYNLSLGLNYSNPNGSPHLLRFITEHVELIHNPPYGDWATFLSCGSTSALEVAFRIFCNRGDYILAEQYTYPGMLESAMLNGIRVRGVKMDAEGLCPDALEEALSLPDYSHAPKPKVLYTIPTGQNPAGFSQPLERRTAIYEIAEKHDLIIIEDDPYYFLRMGHYHSTNGTNNPNGEEVEMSAESFHSYSVPSYLSLDRSGRVVRLDSTSKILAPGLRAGWVTAASQIIDKFQSYQEVSIGAASGASQLMMWHLLDETWGHQGFTSWLVYLSQEYQRRRNNLLHACDLYIPKDIGHWNPPEYGMFLWVKLDWRQHPLLGGLSASTEEIDSRICELESRIAAKALENGVLVTKGSLFSFNKKPNGELHFRLTFAAALEEDLNEAVRLFASTLKEEFSL